MTPERNGVPRMLAGCDVLPAMDAPPDADAPDRRRGDSRKRQAAGRFAALNAFVDESMRTLRSADVAVWLVLFRDARLDGTVRVAQADIARRAGCSDRNVRRSLDRLESAGLLAVVRRGNLQRGPTVYRLRGTPKCDC